MSSVTCGYLNGPQGSAAASAVTCDYTQLPLNLSFKRCPQNISVTLKVPYWPVPANFPRPAFAGGMPFRCEPGASLLLPAAEAMALGNSGATEP
jgi:hypothetical protein